MDDSDALRLGRALAAAAQEVSHHDQCAYLESLPWGTSHGQLDRCNCDSAPAIRAAKAWFERFPT